jgi:energy-coupling factor transporter ATP-binding protein EcfA2
MIKIILISGKQGSGKTTLSNNLSGLLIESGYQPVSIKFAAVLYELHDLIWSKMNEYGQTLNVKKDGYLLQLLGTEWGRNKLGENIWVDIAKFRAAKATENSNVVVIIDDCRFPNELTAFPEALKVRLEADSTTRMGRAEMWRDTENHTSETGLDDSTGFNVTYQTGPNGMSSLEIAQDILNRMVK